MLMMLLLFNRSEQKDACNAELCITEHLEHLWGGRGRDQRVSGRHWNEIGIGIWLLFLTFVSIGKQFRNIRLDGGVFGRKIPFKSNNKLDFKRLGIVRLYQITTVHSLSNAKPVRSTKTPESNYLLSRWELLNARSVWKHKDDIREHVIDHDIDIMLLTETWLLEDEISTIKDLTPAGYKLLGATRPRDGQTRKNTLTREVA